MTNPSEGAKFALHLAEVDAAAPAVVRVVQRQAEGAAVVGNPVIGAGGHQPPGRGVEVLGAEEAGRGETHVGAHGVERVGAADARVAAGVERAHVRLGEHPSPDACHGEVPANDPVLVAGPHVEDTDVLLADLSSDLGTEVDGLRLPVDVEPDVAAEERVDAQRVGRGGCRSRRTWRRRGRSRASRGRRARTGSG